VAMAQGTLGGMNEKCNLGVEYLHANILIVQNLNIGVMGVNDIDHSARKSNIIHFGSRIFYSPIIEQLKLKLKNACVILVCKYFLNQNKGVYRRDPFNTRRRNNTT